MNMMDTPGGKFQLLLSFCNEKPELDLVHMDFFLPLILHIFLGEWHLKTKERSWFFIGVKAPFRRTTIVFFPLDVVTATMC